ncbi:MAG: hypothetical protein IJW62_03570 [Clostridia bacterium]|nr:hypothetical protein [Clostridia bacterium]
MKKSFRPPFSKGGAVEGAQPSSPSAEGETLLRRFSFCQAFSFAPSWSKEKADERFPQSSPSKGSLYDLLLLIPPR